ncbi:MAG TPA: hypothetical protein DCK98_03200 [Chloroflexi bacterium]|nr:hypothetical protein [Chloroflexota bacterium]HAL28050.1 hypothetical protein [Chloroflexota bacterium]
MGAVLAALDGREEASADREGRAILHAAATRVVLQRDLGAPQVIAALFPETALDRIRLLSTQTIRRHAELMIRVMSAEFRHPDHDPRSDTCPFKIGFVLEYEEPEVGAFEARTHDKELTSIDFGEGEGQPARADWYLVQGTRRSIRRAYEPHRDDPWARAEMNRPVGRAHSRSPRRASGALGWIKDPVVRSFVSTNAQRAFRGARSLGSLAGVAASGAARFARNSRHVAPVSVPPDSLSVASDPSSDELHRAERRLANREAAFGFSHPDVASELHLIGAIHQEAGRYSAAVATYGMALVIRERALGPDHPEVASTLEDLAAARRDAGEPEEAERLSSRAQEIRRRASPRAPHA